MMYDYARELVNLGYDVTVYTTDAYNEKRFSGSQHENLSGIKVIRFHNLSNALAWKRKRFLPLYFLRHLKKTIMEYNFIIMADTRTFQNLLTYRECLKYNVPYGMCCFGSLPRRREGIKTLYDHAFVKPMIKNATWLFAQTENEKNEYRKYGGEGAKIKLLPLPIELNDDYPVKKRYDKLRLVFIGRIHSSKGLQNIITALGSIIDNVDFEMNIIGRDDGYLRKILKQIDALKLTNRIKFRGPLFGEEKNKILNESNVFIITPINYEETSTAALEAAAMGCALIITPQADIPYFKEFNAGIVVENNIQNIGAALTECAHDMKKVSIMGMNAREMIKERFDLKKVTKVIDSCLGSLADPTLPHKYGPVLN